MMQFKKYLPTLAVVLCPVLVFSQTTYLPRGDKQEIILDRLEIKAQRDPQLNLSKTKPYSREYYVPAVRNYLQIDSALDTRLTNVDKYYIKSLLANNLEWVPAIEREEYESRRSIANTFYNYPAGLFETHSKDFDLSVNPVLNLGFMKETGNDNTLFYNTRGATLRGRIADKIGFSTTLTDNQERYPSYVQDWMEERTAVPGAGFNRSLDKGKRDYFDARGYITFGATKYVDVTFGYDKNFIGNGQRSLFLSDFGNNNLFLRLNTRIWKFNYQNLFMELTNAYQSNPNDDLLGKKYAAMHHLDINLTKWLNVGLFEGVVFGRANRFEFGYLVPVIFYRSVERDQGSPDNAVVGMDFKANVARTAQLYGQLLFDEFKISELTGGNGWWANKFGYQLGAKYIDAFKVKNLDLQLELNRVRPYTYSHYDSVANYSHYNQPLAHPLMANFNEWIGVARYRPAAKWMIEGRAMYYTQGLDSTANVNFGSNLFLPSTTRTGDYGHKVGSGWKTNAAIASLLLSYEVKENLFIELMGMIRKQRYDMPPVVATKSSTVFNLGVRWNIGRRDFYF